ncbi:MAG: hypothetical protein V2A74_09200, partial [bacterium]
ARSLGGRRLGWFALIALTFLRWHLQFSRLVFRTVLVPFVLVYLFYFLIRALREGRRRNAVVAGIFAGLGFYTYLAYYFALPVVASLFLLEFLARRREISSSNSTLKIQNSKLSFYLIVSALAVALPMIIHYLRFPEHLTGRPEEVSLFKEGFVSGLRAIAGNAVQVAAMFTFVGDHVSKHNIPLRPVFDPVSSFFFYLGLVVCLVRSRRDPRSLFIPLWLFFLLLPSVFSFGAPNLLRTLGAAPAAALLFAQGLVSFSEFLKRWVAPRTALTLAVLCLAMFGLIEAKAFFVDWARAPSTWSGFNGPWCDVARFVRAQSPDRAIVYLPGDMAAHESVRFILLPWGGDARSFGNDGSPLAADAPTTSPETINARPPRAHLVIATAYNPLTAGLARHFPKAAILHEFKSPEANNTWALAVLIPAQDLLSPADARRIWTAEGYLPDR